MHFYKSFSWFSYTVFLYTTSHAVVSPLLYGGSLFFSFVSVGGSFFGCIYTQPIHYSNTNLCHQLIISFNKHFKTQSFLVLLFSSHLFILLLKNKPYGNAIIMNFLIRIKTQITQCKISNTLLFIVYCT